MIWLAALSPKTSSTPKTGEVYAEAGDELTAELLEEITGAGFDAIEGVPPPPAAAGLI